MRLQTAEWYLKAVQIAQHSGLNIVSLQHKIVGTVWKETRVTLQLPEDCLEPTVCLCGQNANKIKIFEFSRRIEEERGKEIALYYELQAL